MPYDDDDEKNDVRMSLTDKGIVLLKCEKCNEEQGVSLPMQMVVFNAMARAFCMIHTGCDRKERPTRLTLKDGATQY